MAGEKLDNKHSNKNKPLKTSPLKYQAPPEAKAHYIIVPEVGYQVDVNTWQERQGIIFEPQTLPLGAKKGNNAVINLQLQDAVYEFNLQLKTAVEILKQALSSSHATDNLADTLRKVLKDRPPEESRRCPDPLKDSLDHESFTTQDEQTDTYPYIYVTGFTYNQHLTTIAYERGQSKSLIGIRGLEAFYYKKTKAVYLVPNHDLANFIEGRQQFIDTFVEAAGVLVSHKQEPVLSSYTNPSSGEEPEDAEYVFVELSMVMFLLEAGIPWRYFSSQDIYQVVRKLCLTKDLPDLLSDVFKEALNTADNQGKTPLMYAIELEEDAFCAETLLARGAEFEMADKQGKRVVDYLISKSKNNQEPSWRALLGKSLRNLKPKHVKPEAKPSQERPLESPTQTAASDNSASPVATQPKVSLSGIDQSEFATIMKDYNDHLKAVIWHEKEILKKLGFSRETLLQRHHGIVERRNEIKTHGVSENELDRVAIDFFAPRNSLLSKLCYDLSMKCMNLAKVEEKYVRSRQEAALRLAISKLKDSHQENLLLDENREKFPIFVGVFAATFFSLTSGMKAKTVKSAARIFKPELGEAQGGSNLAGVFAKIESLRGEEPFDLSASKATYEGINKVAEEVLSKVMCRYRAKRQNIMANLAKAQPALFSTMASLKQSSSVNQPPQALLGERVSENALPEFTVS